MRQLAISERDFQQQVVDLARLFGYFVYHTHDSRRSEAGWPDLTLCRPPRLIFAELKTERGKVRPAQQQWLDALRGAGQEAYLWRPSQWEQIVATLRKP